VHRPDKVYLDPISQTLVDMALEERAEFLNHAIATADRKLEAKLAPVKARYAPDGFLDLSRDEDGFFLTPKDVPPPAQRTVTKKRKR